MLPQHHPRGVIEKKVPFQCLYIHYNASLIKSKIRRKKMNMTEINKKTYYCIAVCYFNEHSNCISKEPSDSMKKAKKPTSGPHIIDVRWTYIILVNCHLFIRVSIDQLCIRSWYAHCLRRWRRSGGYRISGSKRGLRACFWFARGNRHKVFEMSATDEGRILGWAKGHMGCDEREGV